MKEQLMQKIQLLTNKAKESKGAAQKKADQKKAENSLADNIKTKQQAEQFKKLLKSL